MIVILNKPFASPLQVKRSKPVHVFSLLDLLKENPTNMESDEFRDSKFEVNDRIHVLSCYIRRKSILSCVIRRRL